MDLRVEFWPPDRVQAAKSGKLRILLGAIAAYSKIVLTLATVREPDLVFVGYPGWFDLPVITAVCSLRRIPIVFDLFISLYDTAVMDRGLFEPKSIVGRLAKFFDSWACRLASRVLVDTEEHSRYVTDMFGKARSAIGVVPLGADESVFRKDWKAVVAPRRVVFHGTFVPLQGLETILRSAALLRGAGVDFVLIGDGQEGEFVDSIIRDRQLSNVKRTGLLPLDQVAPILSSAAVVLGIFGVSEKAARVVPNKVFEAIAVGRPVITAGTPAIETL